MTRPGGRFDALTQPLQGAYSIEASAGTGKTYSITLLWLRLLLEQRLSVEQILVTTFTRAATAELRERLLASLRKALTAAKDGSFSSDEPESRIVLRLQTRDTGRSLVEELETALSSFDLAPIHTIHGFCQSLISRHTLELGCDPDLDLAENADDILAELVNDELMRQANHQLIDPTAALQVARSTVSNPLATILNPISIPEARERIQARIDDLLGHLDELALPNVSRTSIAGKLESVRETWSTIHLSPAQRRMLTPILPEFESVLVEVRGLHRALAAATLHPIATWAREQFTIRKQQAKVRTFDDILLTVYRALESGDDRKGSLARAVRARFHAAIVDECQDSDSVQIGVFRRLFANSGSFLVIGDPKQSIYRFRGADLSSYRSLAAGANQAPEMTTNYRSDLPLVEALNRLYGASPSFSGGTPDNPIRYVQVSAASNASRIEDARVSEPLLLVWSDRAERSSAKRDLARQIAAEFRRLLDEPVELVDHANQRLRRVCASDLAVLATSHSDLLIVRRELQALGIPCEQAGASLGSVWKSDEALDVHAWLKALAALEEQSDPLTALLAFAATPLFGLGTAELARLGENPTEQALLSERLLTDAASLRFHGPLPLLQRYWSGSESLPLRLKYRDGERRLTNWRQIGCLLQEEWSHGHWLAAELALWLSRKRGEASSEGEATLMKLETDMAAVQLATIFAAKGLEYPIVACPFLWHVNSRAARREAPIAVVRRTTESIIDVGSEHFYEDLQEALTQEEEEQERLLYVALTRARHRVYVGLAPVSTTGKHDNGAENSALAALLGISKLDKHQWLDQCPLTLLSPRLRPSSPTVESVSVGPSIELAKPPNVALPQGSFNRCSSYSALVRNEEDTPKDYDPDDPAVRTKEPGLLAALNLAGNRLGQRMHRLLEEVIGNHRDIEAVTEHLGPEWKTALATILETPMAFGSETVVLAQVRARAIAEMHVMLPVASIAPSSLSQALVGDPLIAADPERRTWAEEIAAWTFGTLAGYFQGYIDLIFEHRGRFYVVDYKTNTLPSYENTALERAMLQHHYLLQARLYTLALHRHLKATLAGYRAETHLGGCAYLFLRGLPKHGVWFEPIQVASLLLLDHLFAEASA